MFWLIKLFHLMSMFFIVVCNGLFEKGVGLQVSIAVGVILLLGDSIAKDWKKMEADASAKPKEEPKPDPKPFKLTEREMRSLVWECDDTAGMLVKESTLRFFIERAVNEDRKERG